VEKVMLLFDDGDTVGREALGLFEFGSREEVDAEVAHDASDEMQEVRNWWWDGRLTVLPSGLRFEEVEVVMVLGVLEDEECLRGEGMRVAEVCCWEAEWKLGWCRCWWSLRLVREEKTGGLAWPMIIGGGLRGEGGGREIEEERIVLLEVEGEDDEEEERREGGIVVGRVGWEMAGSNPCDLEEGGWREEPTEPRLFSTPSIAEKPSSQLVEELPDVFLTGTPAPSAPIFLPLSEGLPCSTITSLSFPLPPLSKLMLPDLLTPPPTFALRASIRAWTSESVRSNPHAAVDEDEPREEEEVVPSGCVSLELMAGRRLQGETFPPFVAIRAEGK
jgi:hypothetical protein